MLPKFNNVFLEIGIKSYQTYSVSNPIEGVAVWSAPNQKEIASSGSAAIGFSRLFLSSLLIPFLKALRIFRRFETMQKKYAPEPHYYLDTIAVLPESQGRGLASKLIMPFLEKADEQSVSTYTETMTPSNVGLYEHFGFQCMEQYQVPRTELNIWAFLRPPKRKNTHVSFH